MKRLRVLVASLLLVFFGYIVPAGNPKEAQTDNSLVTLKGGGVEISTVSDIDCRRWDYDIEWQ